jgi:hypothetical protein
MKRTFNYAILTAILLFCLAGISSAAAFTGGNLVVCRVGDGSAALGSSATPVFLDEYTTAGAFVQSVPMPIADSGANQTLTASGSATAECFITRSADRKYLIITGYDAPVGTATVASSSSATFPRVMGRIDNAGTLDTSTTTTGFVAGGIRSATSDDGSRFWAVGSVTGVVFQTLGASGLGTTVSSTATNLRTTNIFNGQLYIASGAGTIRMGTVGSGLPTAAATVSVTLPANIPTAAPFSFNGFFFADLSPGVAGVDTLYVADDQSAAAGAVRKYTWDGSTWTATGASPVAIYRGLTANVGAGSSVTLFATRGAAGNELVAMTDASGYGGTFAPTPVVIATAATNTAFRGVQYAPLSSTAATAVISGRVTTAGGRGIGNAMLTLSGGGLAEPLRAVTGNFGYFVFPELPVGQNYVLTVSAKRYRFTDPSRVISLQDNFAGADFIANSQE